MPMQAASTIACSIAQRLEESLTTCIEGALSFVVTTPIFCSSCTAAQCTLSCPADALAKPESCPSWQSILDVQKGDWDSPKSHRE